MPRADDARRWVLPLTHPVRPLIDHLRPNGTLRLLQVPDRKYNVIFSSKESATAIRWSDKPATRLRFQRGGVVSQRTCEGKVALVTGASKGGTGTAIAIRLAAEGAKVMVTARTLGGLEETQSRIKDIGGEARVVPCDLSDPEGGRAELVARTEAELGPIDILVNNAAANGYHPFETTTVDALERCLQVNLWAPWQLMQRVVGGMRERGKGWILNISSFDAELHQDRRFRPISQQKEAFSTGHRRRR